MKNFNILLIFLVITIFNFDGYAQQIEIVVDGTNKGRYSNGEHIYVKPGAGTITFKKVIPNGYEFEYYNSGLAGILNNGTNFDYESFLDLDTHPSSCDALKVRFYKNFRGNINSDTPILLEIYIYRTPPSPSINGTNLCEGQSASFSTDYIDNTISYNWYGTGGVNVSSNNYQAFVSLNSPGYLNCIAINQCGSNSSSKGKMGAPEYDDVQIYNFSQYINPGGTKALTSASNSSWSTYYGNFDGSQNASGGLVWYTANYAPEQIIYLTHSNSCGSLTREFSLYTNPDWQPNRIYKADKELIHFSEANNNTTLLSVYPNPAINTLNLQLPESYSLIKKGVTYENIIEKIALYDKQGDLVRNINDSELQDIISNKKIVIDIKNLLPNEYYLHVTSKKGKIEKIRILIGDK